MSSALQAARNALLSQRKEREEGDEGISVSQPRQDHTGYQAVEQLSPELCTRRLTSDPSSSSTVSMCHHRIGGKRTPSTEMVRIFAPAGQVEHMERVQAGKQYLMFRRLYSDLEREQVRKKKLQGSHSHQVRAMKRMKEEERQRIEAEVDSSSVISTSISEDRQKAEEWAELVSLEEQKQQLQRAKEMERYVAALKVRLREQVEAKKVVVPPLCSCARTVWDTNPMTCANNCIFYRNTKGDA